MESAGLTLVSVMLPLRGPIVTLAEGTVASAEQKATTQGTKNPGQGAAYEKIVEQEPKNEGRTNIEEQVTIKPNRASNKVRMDFVSQKDGNVILTDAKSSSTAGLTKNQKTG